MENAQCAETKVGTQNGEEALEECGGPANFGEQENDNLNSNKQAVDDGPEDACGLVWDRASSGLTSSETERNKKRFECELDVVTVHDGLIGRVLSGASRLELVEGSHIRHDDKDATREYEQECDNAQGADGVETDEEILGRNN